MSILQGFYPHVLRNFPTEVWSTKWTRDLGETQGSTQIPQRNPPPPVAVLEELNVYVCVIYFNVVLLDELNVKGCSLRNILRKGGY